MGGCSRSLGVEPPAAGVHWGLQAKPQLPEAGVWGQRPSRRMQRCLVAETLRSKMMHFAKEQFLLLGLF